MASAFLFDLDGTLIDSLQDILNAQEMALQDMGIPATVEDLYPLRGGHLSIILAHFRGVRSDQLDPEDLAAFSERYRALYMEHMFDHTQLFPGVMDMLQRLRHCKKAVATSKPMAYASRLVSHYKLEPLFDAVVGSESLRPKPYPDVFLEAAKRLGARPNDCLVVGDTYLDMAAGKQAGCKTCLILHGKKVREIDTENADVVIRNFGELG